MTSGAWVDHKEDRGNGHLVDFVDYITRNRQRRAEFLGNDSAFDTAPGSELASDEAWFGGFTKPPSAVVNNLLHGLNFWECIDSAALAFGQLPKEANGQVNLMHEPYLVLFRCILESASAVCWLLSPDGQDNRIKRMLLLFKKSIGDERRLLGLFPRVGADPEAAFEEMYDEPLRECERRLGVDLDPGDVNYTKIVRAGQHAVKPGGSDIIRLWRMGSAAAHNDYATFRSARFEPHDTKRLLVVEPDVKMLATFAEEAHRVTEAAFRLWMKRNTAVGDTR